MQEYFRGPYRGVVWFCNDGEVLEPKSYACVDHGGGVQHAILGRQAERLARWGVHVGTVLRSLKPEDLLADDAYRARALVVERYLERALDGWTLKAAKSYRGFRQVEDEEAASLELLVELAKQPWFIGPGRSLTLRLVRALPYSGASSLADEVRALAGTIGDTDKNFAELRFKIHAFPEPADIDRVRTYCAARQQQHGDEDELLAHGHKLATKMEQLYNTATRLDRLRALRRAVRDRATQKAIDRFADLDPADTIGILRQGAGLIHAAAKALKPSSTDRQGDRNLHQLHSMSLVEELWIGVTADLRSRPLPRQHALEVALVLVQSAHGLGLLSARETHSAADALSQMSTADPQAYASGLRQAVRVLPWIRARLLATVGIALERYQQVEPRAQGLIDDILRSGVTLPLAAVLDRLAADLERIRGGGHRVLGSKCAATVGIIGENPGLATGPLRVLAAGHNPSSLRRREIVLLHELPPELPPVAGILTVGQAGSLSHVSLLARNLGIPHASIDATVAEYLERHSVEPMLLGVSLGRRVVVGPLSALSEAERQLLVQGPKKERARFSIDVASLDLATTDILDLKDVSEKDSGVRVGPKAGELGRLKRLFPGRVSGAAIIPFGVFRQHVTRLGRGGEPSPLDTLLQAYMRFAEQRSQDEEAAEKGVLAALARFRAAIIALPFPEGFEKKVDRALGILGRPNTFGVFVRSDTNVEDLKDFTGAGLNLTVLNRVRRSEIFAAIRQVWASPFTERSFRWRQRLLDNPEHVYPSVILHKTVPSELSGVMVTMDLETGGPGLTISASEGVAAVVDGGAPETIILPDNGPLRLVSSSRSATRKVIPRPPAQGIHREPAKGKDPLLGAAEQAELRSLIKDINARIPPREEGVPWDIEFGMVRGKAYLMQIRPLRVSRSAATHKFLKRLDASTRLPDTRLDLFKELP